MDGQPLTHPQRAPDLLTEDADDEVVVFLPSTGRVATLNAVGAAVLELCDGTRTTQAIVSTMVELLPADPEQMAADVAQLLQQFCELDILQPEG